MKPTNNAEKISKLETEVAELRAEFDALKKLVYQIDDMTAESIKSTIKDAKARRKAVGE